METYYRGLTNYEIRLVTKMLLERKDTEGNDFIKKFNNINKVIDVLKELALGGNVAIFYEGKNFIGILVYFAGQDWWTTDIFLVEELVLCTDLKYKGFTRIAIKELEKLARKHKAKLIIAGCFFQENPKIVTNAYKKAGYKIGYPTCMKEVH